ncbi:hydrogenase expression/formation protein HypE [Geothermobacter hydrogeniphilus]|uniref:Hydrogenase expression/formation protein HypE n=1 Tax=Geothermobacter hydrogeniphilus TaxID=1969733 RepID=A0A2K2H7W5_9BACT|nr:hydrogenase expression/formation protein HypE [Geothermobacter hydrogeniphilus]PNU19404.1 hydrogenase expression/formation protein HypE [Geothermobacter hydrogeniphilus]
MNPDIILLGHGSGGKLSHQLLDDIIIPALSGVAPEQQNDAAVLPAVDGELAFTTDSYVVDPIFFPGGNIGDLAVNGTVNDLAMAGAEPVAISVGLILEEGLAITELRKVLESMRQAADAAGVKIVTGDTKVVPRGKGDKIFINTAGIGRIPAGRKIGGNAAKPGDKVLINGAIGDHGMAVLASREGLELNSDIETDSAALNDLVEALFTACGEDLHVLRDPTRGGVATTLREIAGQSRVDITLDETALPIHESVRGACAILGLDPLFVANEGKLLAIVTADRAEPALQAMRRHPAGGEAAIIGEVSAVSSGRVLMRTTIGGLRAIEMLAGEQLPRIC